MSAPSNGMYIGGHRTADVCNIVGYPHPSESIFENLASVFRGKRIFSSLIATGFLWGVTNPFLKIGAQGVEKIHDSNKTRKSLKELYFFITNWRFILPYLVNQCGSLLFVITLQSAELTLANPIANSLSILFTFVGGWLLGEEVPDKRTFLGMLLVIGGIACYIMDKAQQTST